MKSIIFTLTFILAGILTANADVETSTNPIGSGEWKEGNYFFLKSGNYYLSLDNEKTDSVIVKTFGDNPTKAVIDYALWEITSETNAGGTLYKFKNKRTQATLSFEASENADLNLAPGVDTWTFNGGKIEALYDNGRKTMALTVDAGVLKLSNAGSVFDVYAPSTKFVLTASQLGDGFQVFQLDFDKTYDGNIFAGKDLLAKDISNKAGFVTLQIQGDETFPDGKAKHLGVDTLKTNITNATDVFGAKFSADSTRTVKHPNAAWQQFQFTVDLKNDSLDIYVAAAPAVNDANMPSIENVKIVSVGIGNNHYLTVAKYNAETGVPAQGVLPTIKRKKGNPGTITTGSGVYFLKSASKQATAGKYITGYNGTGIVTTNNTPSVYQPEGQWYIKETNGMYSIVDRNTNSSLLRMGEIFPVQDMANTFTFGNGTDSITVEHQSSVSLTNAFLGSRRFSKEEIANNGYALNLLSGTPGVNNLFVFTVSPDSILQVKSGEASEAIAFKLEVKTDSAKNVVTGLGAQALGDTLYHTVYTLKQQYSGKSISFDNDEKALKLSSFTAPNEFIFRAAPEANKYILSTNNKNVTMNISSAHLVLTDDVAYFNFIEVDAPEYATFGSGHKRLTSDNRSLTMNPLSFLAEMKTEGQEITKANYETENFSLWIEKAPSTPDKQLYYVTKGVQIDGGNKPVEMNYLVSLRDSAQFDNQNNALVGFVTNDTITTMENSPALFAFKTTESGRLVLESQKELGENARQQYIGFVNNRLVMSSTGIEFDIANAPAPIANENPIESEIIVSGETGSVTIFNAGGKKISIVNILGQVIATRYANTDYFTMPATRGVVFVVIDGERTHKALVK